MPRRQIFVRHTYHSAEESDICVRVGENRYSVVVRNDLLQTMTNKDVTDIALMLAVWARRENHTDDIFVHEKFGQQLRTYCRNRVRNAAQWRQANPVEVGGYSEWTRTNDERLAAEEKARVLLHTLDPDLALKMDAGKAFYKQTPSHKYIWYPNQRAIVWLGPEEPKYVCVHSRDHHVESNKYDWAITMSVYLKGNEEHLRKVANYHSEYYHRGDQGDYHAISLEDVGKLEGVLSDERLIADGDTEDEGSILSPLGADDPED